MYIHAYIQPFIHTHIHDVGIHDVHRQTHLNAHILISNSHIYTSSNTFIQTSNTHKTTLAFLYIFRT